MRKKTLMAALVMAMILTGCTGNATTPTNVSADNTEEIADEVTAGENADKTREEVGTSTEPTESEDTVAFTAKEEDDDGDTYPAHPITKTSETTYDLDGISVDVSGLDIKNTYTRDTKEQVMLEQEDGSVFVLNYEPITYDEITEEEVRNLYQLDAPDSDIEVNGNIWTVVPQSDLGWMFFVQNPETNEDVYTSENGDVMACATNVYTNSDGDVAIRSIAYAAHDGDAKEILSNFLEGMK